MDFDEQLELGHLLLNDRKCKSCGEVKNLVDDFYRTRKDRGAVASSYSYECKDCTIKRIVESKKKRDPFIDWDYPDWQFTPCFPTESATISK